MTIPPEDVAAKWATSIAVELLCRVVDSNRNVRSRNRIAGLLAILFAVGSCTFSSERPDADGLGGCRGVEAGRHAKFLESVAELQALAGTDRVSVRCVFDHDYVTATVEFDLVGDVIEVDGALLQLSAGDDCQLTDSGWVLAATVREPGMVFVYMEGASFRIKHCVA